MALVFAGMAAPVLSTIATLALSTASQSLFRSPGLNIQLADPLAVAFPIVLKRIALLRPVPLATLKYPAVGIEIVPPRLLAPRKPKGSWVTDERSADERRLR